MSTALPVITTTPPPLPPSLPASRAAPQVPAAPPKMDTKEPEARAPHVTTGVVTFPPENNPAPPRESKPAPAAPVVTSGVVTFEDEPPLAAAWTDARPNPAQLRSRIEAVCAGAAREVEVTAGTENNLRIRLKVASEPEAARLSEKVLGLPELAPYDVTLDVQVAR
jgi:hypothetical protein